MKALRMLILMTFVTGVFYPISITMVAQKAFAWKANGSLVKHNGHLAGSELIAQRFSDNRYFSSRPSAADFATIPSGASNKGPTSRELRNAAGERSACIRAENNLSAQDALPSDMVYASGSGLDPHISPAAARIQIPRIAAARSIRIEELEELVSNAVEQSDLRFLGEPRVNVLKLNQALDNVDCTR